MKFKPLPAYEYIEVRDIPPASIFLFYGGNALTSWWGNRVFKHEYRPASFHAAGGLGGCRLLNIGKTATIRDIRSMFQSTHRIDVIILHDLTDEERAIICRKFERDAGANFYDVAGYARHASKSPALRFLKWIKSSNKNDYCSDNVVDNFSEPPIRRPGDTDEIIAELTLPRKIEVSAHPGEDSAPWHLLEHALAHPQREIRRVWEGIEFKNG